MNDKCPSNCWYLNNVNSLKAELSAAKAEIEWLEKRDCHADIELCYDDGDNPFAREDLEVVDVGVADNCYVVSSKVVEKLQAEIEKLRGITIIQSDIIFWYETEMDRDHWGDIPDNLLELEEKLRAAETEKEKE